MRDEVTLHYVIPAVDGPIPTGSAGISDPHGMMSVAGNGVPVEQRLRFACDPRAVPTHHHRPTGEVARGAGGKHVVSCPKCLESEEFKAAVAEMDAAASPAVMFDASGKRCC